MFLLDKVLRRLIRRGQLTVTDHDGKVYHYGAPADGIAPVAIRFADAKVASAIVRSPELGAAESYMEGRLTFDEGDIQALIDLASVNGRFEDGTPRRQGLAWRISCRGRFPTANPIKPQP